MLAVFSAGDALPLTPNGTLDRAALPRPQRAVALDRVLTPAVTETEKMLASIWKEVLSCAEVGLETDVLALGADSIQLFQIVARAHRAGLPLSTKMLLQHRRLGMVAAVLTAARDAAPAAEQRPSLKDFRRARA